MTENENSPENLRKYLESDDPAMVMKGLSMAERSGVPEVLHNIFLKIAMWNSNEDHRKEATKLIITLPKFERLLSVWNPSKLVLMTDGDTNLAYTHTGKGKKNIKLLEEAFQELTKLPSKEYLDLKITFLLQVPGKRKDMIEHLSDISNKKIIDSLILITKTFVNDKTYEIGDLSLFNIESIETPQVYKQGPDSYVSPGNWSYWTCKKSKLTILVRDMARGDELPEAFYPSRNCVDNFVAAVEVLGKMKAKKTIPLLKEIISILKTSAENLNYVGEIIKKAEEEGEDYTSETFELYEWYIDFPGQEWPPTGANVEKVIKILNKVLTELK